METLFLSKLMVTGSEKETNKFITSHQIDNVFFAVDPDEEPDLQLLPVEEDWELNPLGYHQIWFTVIKKSPQEWVKRQPFKFPQLKLSLITLQNLNKEICYSETQISKTTYTYKQINEKETLNNMFKEIITAAQEAMNSSYPEIDYFNIPLTLRSYINNPETKNVSELLLKHYNTEDLEELINKLNKIL